MKAKALLTIRKVNRVVLVLFAEEVSVSCYSNTRTERFHSRGQQLCNFIGQKKAFTQDRVQLPQEHQHGRRYVAYSLRWPASMQIYWNKRKHLHKKRVQLSLDFLGTPT